MIRVEIRSAVPADTETLLDMAEAAHAETAFAAIPFSRSKAERLVHLGLSDPDSRAILVAVRGDTVCGALSCSLGEYYVGEGPQLTTIHAIYVPRAVRSHLGGGRAARALLMAVRTWSLARGAQAITLHVTSGHHSRRTDKLARALGFHPLGGNYLHLLPKPKGN